METRDLSSLLLWAALLCGFPHVSAGEENAELPEQAKSLLFEFEVLEEEAFRRAPLDRLLNNYGKHLEELQKKLQDSGNLDGALAVERERKAIESGSAGRETGNDPPELKKARLLYEDARGKMLAAADEKVQPLRRKLIENLERLVAELTRAGKINEALAVKARLDLEADRLNSAKATGPDRPERVSGRIQIKVQVDGRSHVLLRGDEIWFDHRGGAWTKPGLHQGSHPTRINDKTKWMPVWNGNLTHKFDAGIGLPVAGDAFSATARVSSGRGMATIVQQPAPENDYTIKVELFDGRPDGRGFNSSDWLDFRIDWKP